MRLLPALLLPLVLLAGCGELQGGDTDPDQVDSVEAPALGACRVLGPDDVAQASNATRTVECSERHTAQTFAVGDLPEDLHDAAYDSEELGAFAYETCSTGFQKLLGADESLVMRTVVSWAWFRPSEDAWDDGARWYRCDVVGGGEQSTEYVALPETAEGLLMGRPQDKWMVCAVGPSVDAGTKVPCSAKHDWRAVTTIKVGDKGDEYPGDRIVEVTTRDYCSESVGAWLGYPVEYDFGYTWFHEADWQAGNRRSVCWARTPD
ncbi:MULTISPECIES: septum formation family protein [unclassified Nocardioides]|uniref:septum formation family protein n=1 Tax=unclassified Nocardioides TaxID=2615069 RepID=UPI0026653BF2|nr:septum formation family protein [Nocardioides sp. Arc9.136]WKN47218.1 septum formation family protein [Nocardioides sp. Arc9.136]